MAGAEEGEPSLLGPSGRRERDEVEPVAEPVAFAGGAGEILEGERQVVAGGLRRGDELDRRPEGVVGVDQQVEPVEDARRVLEGEQRFGGRHQLRVQGRQGVEGRRCRRARAAAIVGEVLASAVAPG